MSASNRLALVHLVSGFVVWSLGFVLLYALQALGCAYGWSQHRLWLISALVAVLVPLAWLAWRPLRTGPEASSLATAALWANRAALGAAILVFLPVTFASTCI